MKATALKTAALFCIALSIASCSCTQTGYLKDVSGRKQNTLLYLHDGCSWANEKDAETKPLAPLNHFCHEK